MERSHQQPLAEEHATLLRQVCLREQGILDALEGAQWPAAEIDALVGYLRYEVFDQAVNEERLLFPLAADADDATIEALVRDHAALRDAADELATAARVDPPDRDQTRLADMLRELLALLERHLRNEELALASLTAAGVTELRQPFRSHEWYPLTEGPMLDMDVLPPEFAQQAAIDRLGRLHEGEVIDVQSRTRLHGLWLRAQYLWPGRYSWVYVQQGPDRWQATVTHRVHQ